MQLCRKMSPNCKSLQKPFFIDSYQAKWCMINRALSQWCFFDAELCIDNAEISISGQTYIFFMQKWCILKMMQKWFIMQNLAIGMAYLNAKFSSLFNDIQLVSQFVVFPHFLSAEWLEGIGSVKISRIRRRASYRWKAEMNLHLIMHLLPMNEKILYTIPLNCKRKRINFRRNSIDVHHKCMLFHWKYNGVLKNTRHRSMSLSFGFTVYTPQPRGFCIFMLRPDTKLAWNESGWKSACIYSIDAAYNAAYNQKCS